MQDRELYTDFESYVTFYKDFIKQSSGNHSNEARRVAEVGSHQKGNDGVENWYHSKEDYKKLSTNAKEKLRNLRKGRPQGGRTRGGGETVNKPHKNIHKLEKNAKKFQRTIKKLEAKRVSNDDNEKSNSSDSDYLSADDADVPNHNHPALTLQATDKGEVNFEERNNNNPVNSRKMRARRNRHY